MKRRYVQPAVSGTLLLVLERRFCAGSDVMQDAELESVGIETEEYDIGSDSSPFNFSWEESL